MSNADPNSTGNEQPPAGYPGAPQPEASPLSAPEPPSAPAYPAAPPYSAPPAYAAPPAYSPPAQPVYQAQPGYPVQPGYPSSYAPPTGYQAYPPATKTNVMAIVSLILSIAGIILIPFIGSLVGAILGHIALGQLKTSGEQGRGLALAGVIVGWVGLALAVLFTILIFAWIGWFTTTMTTYTPA